MKLRQTALALALLGASLLTPIGVSATASDGDDDPFTGIAATGSSPDGAAFIGTMDIQHFDSLAGHLIVIGTLSGQVTRPRAGDAVSLTVLDGMPIEVPVGSMVASCDRLSLAFGPVPLQLNGPEIQVAPIRITSVDRPEGGPMAEARLCTLADQLRSAPTPSRQAGFLDAARREFD